MKTDRRHELQTNVLADWIGKHLGQVQGHSKTILALVLLVIAAGVAGTFLVQDQAARSQAGWNQFFQAFGERDPEALEIVASANQGTTAGVWAHLAEADLKLAEGIGDLYTNRDNAKRNLAEAERNYLVVEKVPESILRQRAWFGLGQVYESMANIEKAKEYYGKLASSSATSGLGKEAQRRTDALSDTSTEKWYNWFANQTPRPPAIPGMPGGPGSDLGLPNLPADLGDLSDRPDLSLPVFPSTVPGAEPTPPADDSSEAGPELNGPSSEADATPKEDAEEKVEDAVPTPKKEDAPEASDPAPSDPAPSDPAPSDPAASKPVPEPSKTPASETPASDEAPSE